MKLVVLDRDGTINEDRDDYVKSPEEWLPLPGALEAIATLNHAGWHVVLATNQSAIGRGLFDMAALNAMHLKMNTLLAQHGGRIDAVFFCPHRPEDECHCRKPAPGLFEQIARRYGLHGLSGVPVVGDTARDLVAGATLGGEPHLVRTGKAAALDPQQMQALLQQVPGVTVHDDLTAFVEHLLRRERSSRAERGAARGGAADA